MATYGVSISIPPPWGDELQSRREDYGDPLAYAIPPHVTLLPPTQVEDEALPAFEEHLRLVGERFAPFEMLLRGTGTFRPISPVVFVQVASGIPWCEMLEQAVRSGPVERELDFPYHPHVTVAHAVAEHHLDEAFEGLAHFEARFEVADFHLYRHGEDSVWRPVADFALTGT